MTCAGCSPTRGDPVDRAHERRVRGGSHDEARGGATGASAQSTSRVPPTLSHPRIERYQVSVPAADELFVVSEVEGAPGVLIVDDETSVHDDFERYLTTSGPSEFGALRETLFQRPVAAAGLGYTLHHCHSGEEAIEFVASELGETLALAFVDMRMGGAVNGVDTLAAIQRRRPNVHLVLCTAYSDFTWDQVLDELGAETKVHLLRKPFKGWQAKRFAEVLVQKWRFGRRSAQRSSGAR